MAITYIPFEELFASEYQLTYISMDGHIDVGPNTYSVFTDYTMMERQQIFQVCEKHLPWQITQKQEHWERTMYMYQFVIKSPSPFPYLQYPLSGSIIMAFTTTEEKILKLVINELSTRKKLDVARALKDADLRTGISAVQSQVDATWSSVIQPLQANFNAAEKAIIDEFKS